jgi:crossover junction endodeoxyribonuclease RusA
LSKSITLQLPWPPSINHYWRHTKDGKHYISLEGKIFRETVYYGCRNFRQKFLDTDRLSIQIDAHPPDRRKRDLDNLLKGVLDALQYARVYRDDFQVDRLTIERKTPSKGHLIVTIKTID